MAVWRRSVEASHHFLTRDDITAIEPDAAHYLKKCDVLVVEKAGELAGFMMMDGTMVEALFIDPDHMGKGLGTMFIKKAREIIGPGVALRLDVNEQNDKARRFYETRGFKQIGRSPTDSAGRPFPQLHLQLDPVDAGVNRSGAASSRWRRR
ncbi:MAG: GNAT family N-acetyltransferase [Planctomycetes bacterium]|nr:GNAT family N-acetyltransferase [Planctomycetota bacterium]